LGACAKACPVNNTKGNPTLTLAQRLISQLAMRLRLGNVLEKECLEAMMFNPVKASCAPLGVVQ